jgi:hypothetical protein
MRDDPTSSVKRLESYWIAQTPATYWIDMVFDGGEWRPEQPLPMPEHHATRLELTNPNEFAVLSNHQAERLRFTVELTSREIRKSDDRNLWFVTYFARILSVCTASVSAPGDAAADAGVESIGVATMRPDGTIDLQLRAYDPKTGAIGDGLLVYPPGHPDYQDVLKHLGGLKPGEQKPVPPWPP